MKDEVLRHEAAKEIRETFESSVPPDASDLTWVPPSLEGQQVADFLAGRHWSEITIVELRRYDDWADASAISAFLTPVAFHYYLPAFMQMFVTAPDEVGLLLDAVVRRLAGGHHNPSDLAQLRELLTPRELECILMFLNIVESHYDAGDSLQGDIKRARELLKPDLPPTGSAQ